MEGSATFTMVASRTIMSIPAQSTTSASQRESAALGVATVVAEASGSSRSSSGESAARKVIPRLLGTAGCNLQRQTGLTLKRLFCGLAHALELIGRPLCDRASGSLAAMAKVSKPGIPPAGAEDRPK